MQNVRIVTKLVIWWDRITTALNMNDISKEVVERLRVSPEVLGKENLKMQWL